MKKIDVYSYGILALAFVCGCLLVTTITAKAETTFAASPCEAQCDDCVVAAAPTAVPVRSYLPRRVTASTVQRTEVVASVPRVRGGGMIPLMTLEQRPAPAYTVVETPRAPWVYRGLFRDRVVVPRRTNLSIETQ